MIMWGWGAMNPTAVKEAARINFPMDKFVGIWWSANEATARGAGAEAKGYLALNLNANGPDFAALKDIQKHVVDAGKSKGTTKEAIGEVLYNRGVYNSVLVAEAIRNAQRITGKKAVTGEDVRRGFETLSITEARWKELGFEGFAAPVKVSCEDHNGHHSAYMQQWDGTRWVKVSDWITPMKDKVRPMLEAAAADYVSKNQPWPKRSEPCDKSS
jgi:branched-chain amino acid transport system substrate-binding protein